MALKIHIEPLPEALWARGDRNEVFEELYRRCHPQLVELCRRLLRGNGDAEALAQEAFVRAWLSWERFSGARPFWPWLATIARRLCIDYRRRLDRETRHLHVAAAIDERAPIAPDELLETDEEYKSAVLALQRLKPAEQRVITLRDLNGWSYDEIARFEGVTVESIRGSLKRARASLRQSYAKVAAGAPAAVALGPFRGVRRLIDRTATVANRPMVAAQSACLLDVAAAAVVAVLGIGAIPLAVPDGPAAPADIVAAPVGASGAQSGESSGVTTSPAGTSNASPRSAAAGSENGASSPRPLLPLDGVTAPEDAVFTAFTPSPSYQEDRTVYAVGTAGTGCAGATCPVLFKSVDGGASWTRLAATGLTGGTVMLPPSHASDGRIFIAGPLALSMSTNGGASFEAVTPVGGPAAMSPTFDGDHRILLGQAPGWEYADNLNAMRPSGLVVNSTSLTAFPAFSPQYAADGLVFIGATTAGSGGKQSAVFRCEKSLCGQQPAALPGVAGPPSLAVSPSLDRDGMVMAWRGDSLFRSDDRGASFAPTKLPIVGAVRAVAYDPTGRIFVAVRQTGEGVTSGGLLASADGGRTWQVAGGSTALGQGVETVAVLPDGRIMAGLSADGGRGLLCSKNGGETWGTRCTD
ncbi:MAG TPA: sigma-70 family RNA polymerase sigma factor [Acidimicrobiales bacterium]|nr:sigma-70 family RNA polymerase sigma factor [Acidimicrobiales bacterium]